MNNNKKGLSTIVATLLIILLTLVAVGIIWAVVRGVIQGGTEQVDLDAKCLQSNVIATKVTNATDTNFSVTLSRQGGDDVIGGVKLSFTNEEATSNSVVDIPGNIAALQTVTKYATVGVTNPNKVTVTTYFLDSSGNTQLCKTSNPFEF